MADEEVKNPGGRPSAAEAEAHFEAAWTLYLKGTTSASAVARELKLSAQAGADLVNRIRNSFAEKSLRDDSFNVKRQLALERAEHLLSSSWNSYKSAYSAREKSSALKSVLATLEHISDLNGLTSKMLFEMTQKTTTAQEQHEQMKKDLGLTDIDFDDAHFPETQKKFLNYSYEKIKYHLRVTKLEMEDIDPSPFKDCHGYAPVRDISELYQDKDVEPATLAKPE